ncbi:MAG: hypothetical protein ACP5M0_13970 [Desulfomonilaceae bacterium]
MTEVNHLQHELCDCQPGGRDDEGSASSCSVCAPKLALTPEEEAILGRMRAIKQQARPIAERLKALEQAAQGLSSDRGSTKSDGEWATLNEALNRLRQDWKEWEQRLDEAIERKLILLGHRQPH